jgi:hypothetical protein
MGWPSRAGPLRVLVRANRDGAGGCVPPPAASASGTPPPPRPRTVRRLPAVTSLVTSCRERSGPARGPRARSEVIKGHVTSSPLEAVTGGSRQASPWVAPGLVAWTGSSTASDAARGPWRATTRRASEAGPAGRPMEFGAAHSASRSDHPREPFACSSLQQTRVHMLHARLVLHATACRVGCRSRSDSSCVCVSCPSPLDGSGLGHAATERCAQRLRRLGWTGRPTHHTRAANGPGPSRRPLPAGPRHVWAVTVPALASPGRATFGRSCSTRTGLVTWAHFWRRCAVSTGARARHPAGRLGRWPTGSVQVTQNTTPAGRCRAQDRWERVSSPAGGDSDLLARSLRPRT